MLLPTDERRQAELTSAAGSALTHALTFCERNGPTCATASETWSVFVRKAQFGADLAVRMARDAMSGSRQSPGAEPQPVPTSTKPRFEPDRRAAPREEPPAEWRAPVRRTTY